MHVLDLDGVTICYFAVLQYILDRCNLMILFVIDWLHHTIGGNDLAPVEVVEQLFQPDQLQAVKVRIPIHAVKLRSPLNDMASSNLYCTFERIL